MSISVGLTDLNSANMFNKAWENLLLVVMSGACDPAGLVNGVAISDKVCDVFLALRVAALLLSSS